MQQVSYGPFIMSIMLIMSCYTGFFNVWRGWQSLNTGPRFYLRQSSIKYDIIYNLLKRCKNIKHKDVSSFPVWCLFIITGQHDCLRVWQWGQGKVTSCGITYIYWRMWMLWCLPIMVEWKKMDHITKTKLQKLL